MEIRIFNAINGQSVYQDTTTGDVQLVHNGSVVAEATTKRPVNYNRIVGMITSYACTIPDGTRDHIIEDGIELPHAI